MPYVKGTTAAGEITKIRSAVSRAIAAIEAGADPQQAIRDASALQAIAQDITALTADWRAWYVSRLHASGELSLSQLATLLGVSKSRAQQIVNAGHQKGPIMTDTGTEPEPAAVAAAIIVSDQGVLIERRNDRIPPWTFPAGEMRPGETPVETISRRVPEECGVQITGPTELLGRRVHPKTGRLMIYVAAQAESTDIELTDTADLAEVKWASLDETRQLMGDMYPPVRAYLDRDQA